MGDQLKNSFKTNSERYGSTVDQVDFTKAEETATLINQWAKNQTNGLILNIIDPSAIKPITKMITVNALYFKADWLNQFSMDENLNWTFESFNNRKDNILMMSDTDLYQIAEMSKYTVLEKPYGEGSNFLFWIILPNGDSNITEVMEKLNYDTLLKINSTLYYTRVDLLMPIFETESSIDGVELLRKMGINALFDSYDIDALDSSQELRVDEVKQKAKIRVNTSGTEAAAVSCLFF